MDNVNTASVAPEARAVVASLNAMYGACLAASSGNAAPGISYNPSWPGMPGTPFLRPAMDVKHDDIRAAFVEQGFRA